MIFATSQLFHHFVPSLLATVPFGRAISVQSTWIRCDVVPGHSLFMPRKLGHGRHVAPSIRKHDQPDEAGVEEEDVDDENAAVVEEASEERSEERGCGVAVVVSLPLSSAKIATGVSTKRRKRYIIVSQ